MKKSRIIYITLAIALFVGVGLSFRRAYNPLIKNTATLNFPSTNANESSDLTISVTGAADGNVVSVGIPNASVNTGCTYFAWVSTPGVVTIRFTNGTVSPVDPASGIFSTLVVKF